MRTDTDAAEAAETHGDAAAEDWRNKHRPKHFADVIGHMEAIAKLLALLASGRIFHIIFVGVSGVGKTTLARLLAQLLICAARIGLEPCGRCGSCRSIQENLSHPTYHELNTPSSVGSKDELDDFINRRLRFAPVGYNYHVLFIDEAGRLSVYAADLLLKPIEDPNSIIRFVFALIDDAGLPEPLKQRCVTINLEPPTVEQKITGLKRIAVAEDLLVEPGAVTLIAQQSASLRTATAALQQVHEIAGSRSITTAVVKDILYSACSIAVTDFLTAALVADLSGTLAAASRMDAVAGRRFCDILRLLSYLKKSFVGPHLVLPSEVDILLYDTDVTAALMVCLERNAKALSLPVSTYVDGLIEHFAYTPPPSAETFELHAILFVDLCAGLGADERPSPASQLAKIWHMFNSMFDRTIREVGEQAAAERSADVAAYVAINLINAAFARIDGSALGLEAEGLGTQADAAVALLHNRYHFFSEYPPSPAEFARTMTIVLPAYLLAAALRVVRLPDNDENLLTKIYAKDKKNHWRYSDTQSREFAQQLQVLKITVLPTRIVLRNKISGFEAECPVPARSYSGVLPPESLAFTLKYNILFSMFERRDPSVVKPVRSVRETDNKELVVLRFDPASSDLRLFFHDHSATVPIVQEPVPEQRLAELPTQGTTVPFAASALARGLGLARQLGAADYDIQVHADRLRMLEYGGLILSDAAFAQFALSIPAILCKPLRTKCRSVGDGATVRRSGAYYVVEKHDYVVTFAAGRPDDRDPAEAMMKVREGGISLNISRIDLLNALFLVDIISDKGGKNLHTAFKIFNEGTPAMGVIGVNDKDPVLLDKATYLVRSKRGPSSGAGGCMVEFDLALWKRVLLGSDADRIDVIINLPEKAAMLEFVDGTSITQVMVRTPPISVASLKIVGDAVEVPPDFLDRDPDQSAAERQAAIEAEFMAVGIGSAELPHLYVEPDSDFLELGNSPPSGTGEDRSAFDKHGTLEYAGEVAEPWHRNLGVQAHSVEEAEVKKTAATGLVMAARASEITPLSGDELAPSPYGSDAGADAILETSAATVPEAVADEAGLNGTHALHE